MNPFQFNALMRQLGARPNYRGLLVLLGIICLPSLFVGGVGVALQAWLSSHHVAAAISAPR